MVLLVINDLKQLFNDGILQFELIGQGKLINCAGSNGPLFHLFDPKPIRECMYWLQNGHKVAEMIKSRTTEDSQVLQRIRKQAEEKYTSR